MNDPHNVARISHVERLLAALVVLTLSTPAAAFSIEGVTVFPPGTITPQDQVSLEIVIITPSMPASLFLPTQVEISSNEISIDVFADAGLWTALDYLVETVDLGMLQPGTYAYTVVLHPAFPVGWGTRVVEGSFRVVCEAGPGCDNTDICLLPPDPGECDGICPMYFHNATTGECELFNYGCCGGNANNFFTLEQCELACVPDRSDPIPTVSSWGLVVMMLLVLTTGALLLRRTPASAAK